VRHVNGVDVGKNEIVGVGVGWGMGVLVGGSGVEVGICWFDGEQAAMIVRSVSRIVSSFVA